MRDSIEIGRAVSLQSAQRFRKRGDRSLNGMDENVRGMILGPSRLYAVAVVSLVLTIVRLVATK
jgi:hypothetical protein